MRTRYKRIFAPFFLSSLLLLTLFLSVSMVDRSSLMAASPQITAKQDKLNQKFHLQNNQCILFGAATGHTSGDWLSHLYRIDPTSGIASAIGPIGHKNVTGLAFLDDGRLVGSANGDDIFSGTTSILLEINQITGEGQLIGKMDSYEDGGCGRMPDLTFDAASKRLIGYASSCTNPDEQRGIYGINSEDASIQFIGPSGFIGGGNGIAWDKRNDWIYLTPGPAPQFALSGTLVTLDKNSGLGSALSDWNNKIPNRVNALAFQPSRLDQEILYASLKNTAGGSISELSIIDIGFTQFFTVGETVLGLDALAFLPTCQYLDFLPMMIKSGGVQLATPDLSLRRFP